MISLTVSKGLQKVRRLSRVAKYGFVAPLIGPVIRHTSWLDGKESAPPSLLNFSGGGDFKAVGEHQCKLISDRAGISGEDRILDVGCGIGRVALPFARKFPSLDYIGFDVVRYGVEWANKQLPKKTNFCLYHADVRNSFYNPFGRISASSYRFPVDDKSRDLVFATSVFTHLLRPTAEHYLRESARVMDAGGRAYITSFLLDEEDEPSPAFVFSSWHENTRTAAPEEPELAVGYTLDDWHQMASRWGLKIDDVILGSWRGHGSRDDFQDAIIFRK